MRSNRTWVRVVVLVAGFWSGLGAENAPEAGVKAAGRGEREVREESLLFGDGVLGTMLRRSARLSLRPHFGDLINEDHLGLTLGVRYGLTNDWELIARVDGYVGHGLGETELGSKPGFSRVRFGVRYQVMREPEDAYGLVAGLDYGRPVGRPPASMADAYSHLTPHVIFSRRLEARPEWTAFLRLGLDFVTLVKPSALGSEDGLNDDAWEVGPGLNWERGDWSWTLGASFASTAGMGRENDCRVGLAPSVSWKIPAKWTPGRKNRWVLGFGLSAAAGNGDVDFGVRGSLRTDLTLRDLFRTGAR